MIRSNATLCPNFKSKEWKLLVEEHEGNTEKAFEIWETNNFDFPQHILDKVAGFSTLENNDENYSIDHYLADKHRLLEKSKGVLKLKLQKITNLVKKNPQLEEGKKELEQLIKDMNRLEVDFALHKFILTADRMSNSARKWMDSIKNGDKEVTMESLKRMQEYVDSFSILKDLRAEFFTDEEHKKDFTIINNILNKQNSIRADYLFIARQKIADQFSPHFGKIEAEYRRRAELEFNKNQRADLIRKGNKGKDLSQLKQEFIEEYMMAHSAKIVLERDKYVHSMLINTVDIGAVTNILINPKDMNHDLMSMAVESLDKADYDINQKTIEKTKEAERVYQNFIKQVGKHGDPIKQYESILIKMVDEENPEEGSQTVPVIMNPNYYGWEEFKLKHEGDAIWEMQQFLTKVIDEKDMMVPMSQRLGYRLPFINKETFERLASNGVFHTLKEGTLDKFKLRAEDTQFGDIEGRLEQNRINDKIEVITNEAGKERERIPLFYRTKIDPKEQSYDVLSSIILDYNNSLRYKTKTETGIFLEILKDVVANNDISVRTGFKKLLKTDKLTKLPVTKKGESSNLHSALESLIRHRVYGIGTESDPQVAKLVQTLSNYTSIVSLSLNHLSGAANYLQGNTVSWIEAAGTRTGAFTIKDRAKASIKYHKDMPGIVADVGQRVPKSKTNLLLEKFNAMSDFNALDKRFVENNRFKRNFNMSSLMLFNNIGEHATQATTMYAILTNIKVKDSKGNYLDKNFEITKDRNQAMSLDEAFFVNEKGELELPIQVTSTELTDSLEENDMFIISRKIRRVNRDLYGNYDSQNKSRLQRNALGALLMQMRGWLLPGFQKRWRDFGLAFQKDITLDQRSYNQETKQFEEGTYTTAVRFLWNLKGDIKALKLAMFAENWHSLTDQEKANIRKASLELGIAAMLLLIATSSLRDSEDEEDIYVAFLARRLYSELTSFINPLEAVRTFRSPMIVLSTAEDTIRFLIQLVDPTERYETGRDAGEYKLKKRFLKLVPIWKQIDRSAEEALIFLER